MVKELYFVTSSESDEQINKGMCKRINCQKFEFLKNI